jgi:hypothetical protein
MCGAAHFEIMELAQKQLAPLAPFLRIHGANA